MGLGSSAYRKKSPEMMRSWWSNDWCDRETCSVNARAAAARGSMLAANDSSAPAAERRAKSLWKVIRPYDPLLKYVPKIYLESRVRVPVRIVFL